MPRRETPAGGCMGGCAVLFIGLGLLALFGLSHLGRWMRGDLTVPVKTATDRWQARLLVHGDGFHPRHLAVSSDGTVYATDREAKCVWAWHQDVGLQRLCKGLDHLDGIALDESGQIWLIERPSPGKLIWQPESAVLSGELWLIEKQPPGLKGANSDPTPTKLHLPPGSIAKDLAYDPHRQTMLILDTGGKRIIHSKTGGGYEELISDARVTMPGFRNAQAIAAGEDGTVYVINVHGVLVAIRGQDDTQAIFLKGPILDYSLEGQAAFHPQLGLILLDTKHSSVFRLNQGKCDLVFEGGDGSVIRNLTGLAVGCDGRIYLSDDEAGVIAVLSRK